LSIAESSGDVVLDLDMVADWLGGPSRFIWLDEANLTTNLIALLSKVTRLHDNFSKSQKVSNILKKLSDIQNDII
jgi:hypothetical protein